MYGNLKITVMAAMLFKAVSGNLTLVFLVGTMTLKVGYGTIGIDTKIQVQDVIRKVIRLD